MKIKFIKSPVAHFNMAYAAGTEADLPDSQCEMLIEGGFAVSLEAHPIDGEIENSLSKAKKEVPEKKKK